MEFINKTAIITGASQGIGEAIAIAFAEEGANVVLASRNIISLERVAKIIGDKNRVLIIRTDVTKISDIKKMVRATIKKFRGVDILINNSGIDDPKKIEDISTSHLDKVWSVNIKGPIFCSKEVVPFMKKQKYGKIINISSICGKDGNAYHTAYVTSKFALIGFTQTLANELTSYGINVNAVCPGPIETEIFKKFFQVYPKLTGRTTDEEKILMINKTMRKRLGIPRDVANLVLFLASDKSQNIVGQAINTDGGFLRF